MTTSRFDRAAIMRSAHKLFRYVRMKGWDDWPFARCLRYAWAEAKGRAALKMAA